MWCASESGDQKRLFWSGWRREFVETSDEKRIELSKAEVAGSIPR